MKIAIIGAGHLGEQLRAQLLNSGHEVVTTYHAHKKFADLKQFDFFQDDIKGLFEDDIDVYFLTAKIEFTEDQDALKESMQIFLDGIQGSRLVYISSDGIFSGEKRLYTEKDTPDTTTLYGSNLQICEELVAQYQNYCIVRPGYMYSASKSLEDERLGTIARDLNAGKEVSRFTDMYKSVLSFEQAAKVMSEVGLSEYQGIVHVSGERMSVCDFTREGLKAAGIDVTNLKGEAIPKERRVEFSLDTSLDSTHIKSLVHFEPLGIRESIERLRIDEVRNEMKIK